MSDTHIDPPSDAPAKPAQENSATTIPPPAVPETVSRLPAEAATEKSFELTATPAPAVPGYEILAELGRGGMGVVYKARDINLNRVVALKMILAGGHASPDDLQRFLTEAEAVAALQHPNIVQIFEAGRHNGLPYFTLEYVDGGTLTSWVREHPLPAGKAAHLVEQLARGVAYAHNKGIVHRDLKPDNILLGASGDAAAANEPGRDGAAPAGGRTATVPKITDFGLAKRVKGGSGVTHTGAVMGTPSYMAPEQAEGKKTVGAAADVYALGAILYRLVTGRPPFQAATPLDTVMQVVGDEPIPPRHLQPKLPKDLETICLKCLQKDPAKRYASADALADDLARFLNEEPILARPVGLAERAVKWARRRPTVAALAALIVVGTATALAALTALYLQERADKRLAKQRGDDLAVAKAAIEAQKNDIQAARDATEAKGRAAVRSLEQIEVANGLRLAEEGDLSGALLWFAKPLRSDHGPIEMEEIHRVRFALYTRHTPRATLAQILPHANLKAAAFSPDGRRVLTAGDRTVQVCDVATGRPVGGAMKHDANLEFAAFSPDGRRVVTVAGGGVARVWNAATGAAVSPPFKHPGEGGGTRAAISPEGARVVTSGEDQTIRVWDAVTGRSAGEPMRHDAALDRATFSPDGQRILSAAVDGIARVWDAGTGRLIATMKHGLDGDTAVFSADGRFVVTCGWDQSAQVWDVAAGRRVGDPVVHNRKLGRPALSPDGRRLATADRDGTVRVRDVLTGKAIGPALIRPPALSQMSFSPDGRTVLTVGQDRVVRVYDAAAGKPLVAPIRFVEGPTTFAAFSSDARHILIAAKVGVMIWDVADVRPIPVRMTSGEEARDLVASADARVVAAIGSDNVVRFWDALAGRSAGPPQHSARPGVTLSPDGRRAAVVGADNVVRITEVATGKPLGSGWNAADVTGVAFRSDGNLILVLNKDGTTEVWGPEVGQLNSAPTNLGEPAIHGLFSPNGLLAAVAGRVNVCQWNLTLNPRITAPAAFACPPEVRHMEFSHNGAVLVVTGPDGVRAWATGTGQPIGPVIRHADPAARATSNPDGSRILVVWKDGTARVWDAATARPAGPTLPARDERIASFSPDGRLACLSDGSEIRLWDVNTGQPAGPPFPAPGPVMAAVFATDGTSLRTLPQHFTAQEWDIRPDQRPASQILLWAQLTASRRIDTFGGLVPLTPDEQLAVFRELKQAAPTLFAVPQRVAILWRLREALACHREGNWTGMALHLRWLSREATRWYD